MTLEQINQRIKTIVDQLLVKLAEDPESRYLFTLPSLVEGNTDEPVLDCQENNFGIAQLREVITYKYLLQAFKSKQLEATQENLMTCLQLMRQSPVIDYYDLGDYHEFAYYLYKKAGNEKKANIHLLSCYYDRGRAILSCGKTFDCKDLLLVLLKDRERILPILLYVIDFVTHDFEDYQEFLKRSQYLLIERCLVLAEKAFAENESCDKDLRSCIYYALSFYYGKTKRPEQAKEAKKAYKKLGGKRKFDDVFEEIMMSHAEPCLIDEQFLDYILYADSLEDDEICALDEDGNITLEIDEEYSVWEKEERINFLDAFYRPITDSMNFKKVYDEAEQGDQEAIREIARRYREGDGVTACECAAEAWEKKLN